MSDMTPEERLAYAKSFLPGSILPAAMGYSIARTFAEWFLEANDRAEQLAARVAELEARDA